MFRLLFLAGSALCVLAFAAVASGLLDSRLSVGGGGGSGGRARALQSIAAYAALLALGALIAWLARRRPARVVVGALVVLLGLAAFELFARLTELPAGIPQVGNMGMSSRTLHHRYPACATVRLGAIGGRDLLLHTNDDGLRSVHDRESFRSHERRIAVLGDSFVFGLGVPEGVEFPVVLERLLREETGADVAVLNAGIVSYSPYLERLLFDDVVAHYEPQVVLLLLDVTDIGDDLKYEQESRPKEGRPSFDLALDEAESFRDLGPLWNLSRPLRESLYLPWRTLLRRAGRGGAAGEYRYYRFDLELDGVRETNQYFLYRHPLEVTRPYFERTLSYVRDLSERVRARGARFACALIPRFQHWNPAECPHNWERGSYAVDDPYRFEYFRFFNEASPTLDFPFLDLLPAFQATQEFPLVFPDDPHWNERGHAFVARTLARWLQESRLTGAEPGD
jgi:hypothetical protein